jgi:alkylated DNA nucleotide flippase Atl1
VNTRDPLVYVMDAIIRYIEDGKIVTYRDILSISALATPQNIDVILASLEAGCLIKSERFKGHTFYTLAKVSKKEQP